MTFLSLQEFLVVAKLFVPSVRCPIFCHANESDFRYCQRCDYERKVICPSRVGQVGVNIDLSQTDKRLQELLNYDQATSYSKQKDSLQKQLEAFLSALQGQVTLATATPRDLCRFLIFRFIVIAVSSLGSKVDILVAALNDCHTELWILILRN